MIPGEVFCYSSNSFVLCVDQRKEKVPVPKTSRLNPDADVFHSVNHPRVMPPHEHVSSAGSWTEQAAFTTCFDSPSGDGSRVQVDRGSLVTAAGHLAIACSPMTSDDLVGGAANPASVASGADVQSSKGETGSLEDFLESEELRMMVRRQLEYYFSRENLAIDTYLVSQMDADQFVPITTVANFNQVKSLTHDLDLIVEVLRDSPNVQVDECGEKVRPLHRRCIVILREIPESTCIQEVEQLFVSESCPAFVSCQFAHNSSWYVTFANEEDAKKAYCYLREEVKTFRGMPIMARIKAKPLLSCSYATNDMSANCASTLFQQPKLMYTSPVPPDIQYTPPQNLTLFTPPSNMSSIWPTSLIYYDPGMVFAANGYVPTAAYTPSAPSSSLPMPASLQTCSTVCEGLLNSRNSRGNCVGRRENCVKSEITRQATVAYEFVQKSPTSICSLCPISNMHLSEKSSLKPNYAQMALRGKERRRESKVSIPFCIDGKSLSAVASCAAPSCSADVCTDSTVSRTATDDDMVFNSKENRLERTATEHRFRFLKGY